LAYFSQKNLQLEKKWLYCKSYFILLIIIYMKKQDFIKVVASRAWLSQDAVAKVLNGMIEVVTEELQSGREVNITGFGAFKVSRRAERNGVNPRTGESIKIPAMNSPVFRAGKTLKEAVR